MAIALNMKGHGGVFADEERAGMPADLRQQISAVLVDRATLLVSDTVAIFPYSGSELLAPEYCSRVGQFLIQLLAVAVREGRVDARSGFVADLHRLTLERDLAVERLFTFAYLMERTVMDELALIARNGKSTMFGFRVDDTFDDFLKSPIPTGRLFTAPWERVGHPDLILADGSAK